MLLIIGRDRFRGVLLSAHRLMSLDHLVRSGQHARRNLEPDLRCGFQINDQLELGWLEFHGLHSRLTK